MRAWLVFWVVLALALPARADDREDARKAFAAGQAADRRRAWQEAIEHYMRANDLVPHPFAMFNIAKDYERLGKVREAATWYERYLDTSSTSDADRDKVNALLVELRNRPAPVRVTSNPDGARVIINGIPTGATPYKGQLKGGMYRVAVEKGAAKDWKEITVEYGEPVDVAFVLPGAVAVPSATPPRPPDHRGAPASPPGAAIGTLIVRGAPAGALVSIDGVPTGSLPLDAPVAPGAHTVRVTAYGYAPFETTVTVAADQPAPVDVTMTRALGTLEPPNRIRAGYVLGGGAGADVKGEGALYLAELGVRVSQADLSARLGRLGDVTLVDLLVRWALLKSRLAPFVGGGYTWISGGAGYTLVGGLRFDVTRTDKVDVALMVESGLRYYTSTATTTPITEETTSGTLVPIMASLLLVYR